MSPYRLHEVVATGPGGPGELHAHPDDLHQPGRRFVDRRLQGQAVDGPLKSAASDEEVRAAYPHVAARLFDTPLLVARAKLECSSPPSVRGFSGSPALRRFKDAIIASCPLGRIGEPEDMAGVTIYLASRAGAYVTGMVICVDGGISI